MEIKPIKLLERIRQAELPEMRIDRNRPRFFLKIEKPSGQWNYHNGRITYNGQDVGELINLKKPSKFWSTLAGDLAAFLNYTIKKKSKKRKKKVGGKTVIEYYDPTGEISHLAALVEAYIEKIMRQLKRQYDETADGLSYTLDEDGQLILNGMNVTSFVQMAGEFSTQKAKIFLKGLKTRLGTILSNKHGNHNYEKIYEASMKLFEQIDAEIARIIEEEKMLQKD